MGSLELWQEPGVYSRVTAGIPFETLVCSLKSGTCLGMRDNLDADPVMVLLLFLLNHT